MRKPRWPAGVCGVGTAVALGVAPIVLVSPARAQDCTRADAVQPAIVGAVNPAGQYVDYRGNGLDTSALQALTDPRDASQTVNQGDPCDLTTKARGIGFQSGIAGLATTSLTGVILGRLDGVRGQGAPGGPSTQLASAGADGMMALGAAEKPHPASQARSLGPLTVYAMGTFLAGDSNAVPNVPAFSYDGSSGMLGLEYSVNRNLILGLAASFTRMDGDLTAGESIDADVIHGAAYLSYATREWFADALAAYGAVNLDLARPEIGGVARGSTDGGAVAAAARTGYLFDFGKVRAGPIAGLTYIHTRIDGYSETGPGAMRVGGQVIDGLTGSAGLRFLAPFQAGGSLLVPYLNVTLEHQFGDGTAKVTTSLTQQPGTPVMLSFPTFGARDYGKVEGGLTVELSPGTSVNLSGASTFARGDGQDYRISAGLNYRF